jgi:hypothetical protein
VVPAITGASGNISKSFIKYPKKIPGKHDINELRKQPYCTLRPYFGKS